MFRLHNRGETVSAAGTDYSLTTSTAFVDCGTTDPKITLPTAGTYLIWGEAAIEAGAVANDDYRTKLGDESLSADLPGTDQSITYLGASQVGTVRMQTVMLEAGGGNVIAIWAHNNSGVARGKILSARTRIGYVRLY